MDIFRHRPLFFWCASFMAALVAGVFLPTAGACILGGASLVGAGFFTLWRLRKRDGYHAVIALVAAVLACLALVRGHQAFQGSDAIALRSMERSTVQVSGTVTDRRGSGGYLTAYTLLLESVDDREIRGLAILTCHYVSDLRPGNRVTMEAEVIPLSEAAGENYDALALQGDGYVVGLLSEEEGTVTITEEDSRHVRVLAGNFRRRLSARLALLTENGGEGLPSSLLLGDKTYLSDQARRDFTRAGASHLLAISGLHLTLLFGMLGGLLLLVGVPKKIRAILLSAGMVGYLILLGFPPSATRAAIMLGMTYLAYLLSARADSVTSLGLAGALILAVTPYAVADAGFWMSFLATLGIVTVMPTLQNRLERPSRKETLTWWSLIRSDLLRGLATVCVGLVAMSFTVFVVAVVIGEIGVLAPLSTLLLTPLCAAVMALSAVCLPLMNTELGHLLGEWIGGICRALTALTEWLADPSWVVISLRHPGVAPSMVAITAVMTVVTLVLLVVRLPARRRPLVLLPMLIGWVAVGGVLTAHGWKVRDEVAITYLEPSSVSEALVLVSGHQGFVCDVSNGSLSAMTAAATEAKRQGATELSAFMLTHYHTRSPGAIDTLLRREMVRALWLPVPTDQTEYDLLQSCMEKADGAGVPIYLYGVGDSPRIWDRIDVWVERANLSRSQQPIVLVSFERKADRDGDRLVYCGSAVFESDLADTATTLVRDADTVVFGGHGPLFKQPYGTDFTLPADCEVILSSNGDAAAYLDSICLPDGGSAWLGQKRLTWQGTEEPTSKTAGTGENSRYFPKTS